MLKFSENKSALGKKPAAPVYCHLRGGRDNVLGTDGEIDNGRVDENYNSRPA